MSAATDVATVIAYYRAMAQASTAASDTSTGAAVAHMVEHLRGVPAAGAGGRAAQLRVIGEGLLVACYVHQSDMAARYPGIQVAQPLLAIEILAGLRLVDEAFALAMAGEGS